MKTNIPIYRARKLDSDEWVEGYLLPPEYNSQSISTDWIKNFYDDFVPNEYEIDPNTLAIHFPDMIDKNGKKIFASLSEDGDGGDMATFEMDDTYYRLSYSGLYGVEIYNIDDNSRIITKLTNLEVIGIHKGE